MNVWPSAVLITVRPWRSRLFTEARLASVMVSGAPAVATPSRSSIGTTTRSVRPGLKPTAKLLTVVARNTM